jgi:hypothetical protein
LDRMNKINRIFGRVEQWVGGQAYAEFLELREGGDIWAATQRGPTK